MSGSVDEFGLLYDTAREYAGRRKMWAEVQPGELRFHFAEFDPAFVFVTTCIKRNFQVSFCNSKTGEIQDLTEPPAEKLAPIDTGLLVKRFAEKRTYPMRVELAGYYAQDAADFLRRYRFTFYADGLDFQGVKSRRTKAYVDLRMAVEALLKAGICLRSSFSLAGAPLVKCVRGYSHSIGKLSVDALKGLKLSAPYMEALAKCDMAPVDLRYQFDAMNFRVPNDENYYNTIGSNQWLKLLEEFSDAGIRRVQSALNRRSKIVPGSIALEELKRQFDYPQ